MEGKELRLSPSSAARGRMAELADILVIESGNYGIVEDTHMLIGYVTPSICGCLSKLRVRSGEPPSRLPMASVSALA